MEAELVRLVSPLGPAEYVPDNFSSRLIKNLEFCWGL